MAVHKVRLALLRSILASSHCALSEYSILPASSAIFDILKFPFTPNPFTRSAKRGFRLCVPEEWYRRSKSRPVPNIPFEPSQATIRRLAALQESDEEGTDDEEGTAKFQTAASHLTNHSTVHQHSPSRRNSISQRRLSNLFDGWFRPTSPTRPHVSLPQDKKNVSEPQLVEHHGGYDSSDTSDSQDLDNGDFERMLVRPATVLRILRPHIP
jgi:diaphanous 1